MTNQSQAIVRGGVMENFANGIKHYNTVLCSIGDPSARGFCGYQSDGVDDSLPLCSKHRKLINETLREQIAREIEARHEIRKALQVLHLVDRTFNPCYQGVCCCAEDAAIARGGHEPNQVTKDAIREAREMTHDELLAICDNYSFKDSAEPVKALRAVVELHKSQEITLPNGEWGRNCQHCDTGWIYPCPTIQAIERECDVNG